MTSSPSNARFRWQKSRWTGSASVSGGTQGTTGYAYNGRNVMYCWTKWCYEWAACECESTMWLNGDRHHRLSALMYTLTTFHTTSWFTYPVHRRSFAPLQINTALQIGTIGAGHVTRLILIAFILALRKLMDTEKRILSLTIWLTYNVEKTLWVEI